MIVNNLVGHETSIEQETSMKRKFSLEKENGRNHMVILTGQIREVK